MVNTLMVNDGSWFCNVDFVEDEFLSIGEIKTNLQLDNPLSLGESENLNLHHVIEDSTLNNLLMSNRDTETLSVVEKSLSVRFIVSLQILIIMLAH